jgi:hypothetical protein
MVSAPAISDVLHDNGRMNRNEQAFRCERHDPVPFNIQRINGATNENRLTSIWSGGCSAEQVSGTRTNQTVWPGLFCSRERRS